MLFEQYHDLFMCYKISLFMTLNHVFSLINGQDQHKMNQDALLSKPKTLFQNPNFLFKIALYLLNNPSQPFIF